MSKATPEPTICSGCGQKFDPASFDTWRHRAMLKGGVTVQEARPLCILCIRSVDGPKLAQLEHTLMIDHANIARAVSVLGTLCMHKCSLYEKELSHGLRHAKFPEVDPTPANLYKAFKHLRQEVEELDEECKLGGYQPAFMDRGKVLLELADVGNVLVQILNGLGFLATENEVRVTTDVLLDQTNEIEERARANTPTVTCFGCGATVPRTNAGRLGVTCGEDESGPYEYVAYACSDCYNDEVECFVECFLDSGSRDGGGVEIG